MSNRDPLYGKTNESDIDDMSFDSTLSDTADSISHSDTSKEWDEFYDATTSDDSGTMDDMKHKARDTMDKAGEKKDEMAGKAKDMMDEGKHKAEEMAGKAQDKMDTGMSKAGESMDSAAHMLREKGDQQGGTVANVANTAADAMESASSFMKETNTSEMMDQVEAYIRQNPTQALLIAAGVGFVLAKAFK